MPLRDAKETAKMVNAYCGTEEPGMEWAEATAIILADRAAVVAECKRVADQIGALHYRNDGTPDKYILLSEYAAALDNILKPKEPTP